MSKTGLRTLPLAPAVSDDVIAARDSVALRQILQEALTTQGAVTVVLDRRKGDRRQRLQHRREERRHAERVVFLRTR